MQSPSQGKVVEYTTCPNYLAHKVWGIQQCTPRLIQASEAGLHKPKCTFNHSPGTYVRLVVALLSWGLGVPEWGHHVRSQGISRVTCKGKDRRILVMHVPLVMSASWGGHT